MRKFRQLPSKTQRVIARSVIAGLRLGGFFGRGKYNPVTGNDTRLRERLQAEKGGEETALTTDERNRLIAFVRNLDRNSDHFNGFMRQLELNVVGTVGGKASFSFSDQFADTAIKMREAFAAWARECEFFDGLPLQDLLKIALRTRYTTGRCVLVFDDFIEDSGKILMFEGDCVANISDAEFAASFPAGWSQHQGIIKDDVGRTRGVFVSMNQRGSDVFDKVADKDGQPSVWRFVKAADATWLESDFFLYQHIKRVNQNVSVPAIAPSVGTIMDLEDLSKYEMQTAKKASQTLATITQELEESTNIGDGLDPSMTAPLPEDATDDEIMAAAEEVAGGGQQKLSLPDIEGAGTLYDILPPGLKMELLNPTHPNANVIGMVNWYKSCAAWANGAANLFATGQANSSYSASLVEQAITWPMFVEEQQRLKSVLDWMVRKWVSWAMRHMVLDPSTQFPDGWLRQVSYSFPQKQEPDGQKQQGAIGAALKNCTLGLRDAYGPDWKQKLSLLAEEYAYCRELGIPHPAFQTASGQVINVDVNKE